MAYRCLLIYAGAPIFWRAIQQFQSNEISILLSFSSTGPHSTSAAIPWRSPPLVKYSASPIWLLEHPPDWLCQVFIVSFDPNNACALCTHGYLLHTYIYVYTWIRKYARNGVSEVFNIENYSARSSFKVWLPSIFIIQDGHCIHTNVRLGPAAWISFLREINR